MYILSLWAHLVEQFLHCVKIWGGGGANRLKKAKFLHPETLDIII